MNERTHFLVVGAQKCGTTTLPGDLRSYPDVTLTEEESALLPSRDAHQGVHQG